ncbi:MAG: eukaryotic-like serine/threonine-protein kinase [Pseudonocardiales bacterium]|nr:eukaryotic-like serine/threonine-protein kinase [Pseudonocardiales bacterium]
MGDPIAGRVLEGRYRIVQRIARGGMSTVYAAVDERLDREVAVKVMSSALSTDPAFADRFAREARVAARLAHPNAVSVYDQGTDGSHVFLVMELVRGRTLRDLLRERGVLTPAQALSILEPVLGALAAAHRAGLVHRDVKPENILLSDDGAVKVADFGLARAVESDASNTRTGLMMGTVAYCPPEQISRGSADARSDVYSAGIVLFELLTGSAPFLGDSAMAVAYQHVNSEVPPPSSRRHGVPPQLDDVVLRATSREPSGRPLDAGALLAELHDIRIDLGLPVVAVPPRPKPKQDPDATQVFAAVQRDPVTARPPAPMPDATTAPTHAGPDPLQRTVISARPLGPPAIRTPGESAPAGRSGRAAKPSDRRRRARRRTAIVVIVILLLGLLTGYGAWWLTVGRYRQVPNVNGLAQSVATQQLVRDGFAVNSAVAKEFSENVKSGQIIRTDPAASSHVIKGKPVTLVVSRGPERFPVPIVAGGSFTAAQQALSIIPGAHIVRSDAADGTGKIAKGIVIRTDPAAGQPARRAQVITVFVSSGPPVISVPNVTGQRKDEAQQTLTSAGFTANFVDDYSDTVAEGKVIRTSPPAEASAVKFSSVSVVLSKGPAIVTIPDIAGGSDPDEAKVALENLGLVVVVKKKNKAFLDFSSYKVDRVEPGPGTQVRKGSTVILHVK